jgi:hypothetical protein
MASETRNSRIHRGARTSWLMLHGDHRQPEGLLRPFPLHPDLTDVELMSRRSESVKAGTFDSLRLIKHCDAIVDGCLASMTRFVKAIAEAVGRRHASRSGWGSRGPRSSRR